MSNLNGIPSADYFETRLANMWSGINGVVYVEAVPEGTLPAGEYSYIVVNPGESNMQVAKIDGWDSDNLTFNVSDVGVACGVGSNYEVKPHPTGSIVRFSNNYAFWKDIQEAVNSKADDSSISTVGKSNDYTDLDNKPVLSTVAITNNYNDLDNLPTPVSIAVGDKILELSASNKLSATVSASYSSGTKKITLYGANSAVLSEIDCTAFIKDGMIQDVKIVTDPAGYAPGKYLEFDFNTDSGTEDIYIALSDLAVYTAGDGISINNNTVSITPATANKLGGIKVGSGLTINDGTLSADSQTDENYTTAEKTKLAGIESGAQVNVIEKVQVNGTDLTISGKSVNVQIKTINGTPVAGTGDIDIMARHYTEGTGISIDQNDEISISSAYQTAIANKADSSDLALVATSGKYSDLSGKPTNVSDFNNDTGFITANDLPDLSGYQTKDNMVQDLTNADNDHYPTAKAVSDALSGAGQGDMTKLVYDPNNVEGDAFDMDNMVDGTNNHFVSSDEKTVLGNTSGTNTGDQSANDFDIKDLADSTSKRTTWDAKLDSSAISDTNYGGAWNGDTTHAPSKNAVYTKLHTMDVEIGNKAADTSVVKLTGNQTVGGTKTFSSEIVLPSKTTDAANDGTKPATEAQVYKKQDSLTSGTNIKTVNGTSLLGSGNIQTCDIMSETDYGQTTPVNGVPYFTRDE